VLGGLLAARLVYGVSQPDVFPGILGGRVLPLWAVIYSFSLWWMIWSPTEEMTYAGYSLPRAQALSGRTWVAVVLVGFWWAIQHSFLPFIPEWRNVVWRFLAFLPGVVVLLFIYLRTRRLAPLIVAHWSMDIIATVMTMR
jgi:membrane protease YdiL (CAAX protease family)